MDTASATAVGFKAWEAAGLTGVLVIGLILVLYGVWKSMDAREKRQEEALKAASSACEEREAALARRLTDVESTLITELRESATRSMELTSRSLEVSSRATNAIENQTRVTERVLARLDRES